MSIYNIDQLITREQYIAWRTTWKRIYKDLATDILQTKIQIKNEARAGTYVGSLQNYLRGEQAEATSMLELRKDAKEKAATEKAKILEGAA